MELSEEEFWDELRRSVTAAGSHERDELRAADELLAEVESSSAVAPPLLSDEAIDAMVAKAQLDGDVDATDPADSASVAESQSAPRRAGWFSMLSAAAALLLAPKFLLAAGAVTAFAVSTYVVRFSTQTLPFQNAVTIMFDEGQSDDDRRAAQGRVFSATIEWVELIRTFESDPDVGSAAAASVAQLRQVVASSPGFSRRRFNEDIVTVGRQWTNEGLAIRDRLEALDELAAQISYGIRALQELSESGAGSDKMRQHNTIHRAKIAAALDS